MKPPFEIYHRDVDIGDADGHICTAENPEIAMQILAALTACVKFRAHYPCGVNPDLDEAYSLAGAALRPVNIHERGAP